MPSLRIWTPEEVAALTSEKQKNGTSRKEVEAIYDQLIADADAGDFATVTLADDDNKATTRNRLKAAAERRNLDITFRRTRDQTVIFSLQEQEAKS